MFTKRRLNLRFKGDLIKIIDFGFASFKDNATEWKGTPPFMSSTCKVFLQGGIENFKDPNCMENDVFALGASFIHILSLGEYPFESNEINAGDRAKLKRIAEGGYKFPEHVLQHYSSLVPVIKSMMSTLVEERPVAERVVELLEKAIDRDTKNGCFGSCQWL